MIIQRVCLGMVALILATSCGRATSPTASRQPEPLQGQPQPAPEPTEQPIQIPNSWSLRLTAQCGSNAIENCVAGHGFTVHSDGTYQLGPTPQGQLQKGHISTEEMKEFDTIVESDWYVQSIKNSLRGSRQTSNPRCDRASDSSSTPTVLKEQTVEWLAEGVDPAILFQASQSSLCHRLTQSENAIELRDFLWKLARHYYTLPFPEPCQDALNALKVAFGEVSSCENDGDCVLVDEQLFPVQSVDFYFVNNYDACSLAPPLLSANGKLLQRSHDEVLLRLNTVSSSCSPQRLHSPGCDHLPGFHLVDPKVHCQSGKCSANVIGVR